MEIRIGIADSPQVIEIELDHEVDRSEVVSQVEATLKSGDEVLRLVDKKGRDWMVPAKRIAYVEVGTADAERRIGFGA
jgi:CBS domain containing-hemolysin-like protein